MRTRFSLLAALALAVMFAACSDAVVAPDTANFELVDEDARLDASDVNAHVYGSFSLTFEVETEGGVGVILSGPANFPGNPKNAGTCDNGLWINKNGNRTSGSIDKPHPHCIGETEGGSKTIQVVLEPISAQHTTFGSAGQRLQLSSEEAGLSASLTGGGDHSRGEGIVVAYAIDGSTLGTTNLRVGTLTFDMAQYHQNSIDYFALDCEIDDTATAPQCLNLVIDANYEPLAAPAGVGVSTPNVQGFLYWSSAAVPFNYGD